jgi:hypothetical protein
MADHSRGFEFSGAALFTTFVKGAGFDLWTKNGRATKPLVSFDLLFCHVA